jgi:hypothetical protein
MNNQYKGVRKGTLLLAVGLQFGALAAIAAPIAFNPQFQSNNQSMWGSGGAPGLNINRFLGAQWNESASIGGIAGSVFTQSVPFPHLHLPSGWECHGFLCFGDISTIQAASILTPRTLRSTRALAPRSRSPPAVK